MLTGTKIGKMRTYKTKSEQNILQGPKLKNANLQRLKLEK